MERLMVTASGTQPIEARTATYMAKSASPIMVAPDTVPPAMRDRLLSPDVMARPILYLCSTAADGVSGERHVATEFDDWLRTRAKH